MTREELQELFDNDNSTSRLYLQQCEKYEEGVRMHSEVTLSESSTSHHLDEFKRFSQRILTAEGKYDMFCNLLTYPLATLQVTKPIYARFARIFDGRNPVETYLFRRDNKDLEKWQDIRNPSFFSRDAYKRWVDRYKSILIVDMLDGEPNYLLVNIDEVKYIKVENGAIQVIAIEPAGEQNTLAVYDSEHYHLFRTKGGLNIIEEIATNAHDIGMCPARHLWTPKLSPLSGLVGALDWALFFGTSKKHLDLFAAYPIMSGIAVDCDYEKTVSSEAHGDRLFTCDGGVLLPDDGYRDGEFLQKCPACAPKRVVGAGTFVEYAAPDEDTADMRNPVQLLPVDKNSLDYNVEEVERLETDIKRSATGASQDPINNKAVNEKQVLSLIESEQNVLRKIALEWSKLIEWADTVSCKLLFGDSFISASVSLGTEFFIRTPEELQQIYNELVVAEADTTLLDEFQDELIKTKFKNNPSQQQRNLIIINVDPLRHVTKSTAMELVQGAYISREDFMIKINLSSYINRFERENGSLLEFGENLKFAEKINRITEEIKNYIYQPPQQPAAQNDE